MAARQARGGALAYPVAAPVSDELKATIVLFLGLLDEKQRRLFAGLESLKLGRGGDDIVAETLGLDPGTVAKGRRELLGKELDPKRVRKAGALCFIFCDSGRFFSGDSTCDQTDRGDFACYSDYSLSGNVATVERGGEQLAIETAVSGDDATFTIEGIGDLPFSRVSSSSDLCDRDIPPPDQCCPSADDGFCDEPADCPPGSDGADCP